MWQHVIFLFRIAVELRVAFHSAHVSRVILIAVIDLHLADFAEGADHQRCAQAAENRVDSKQRQDQQNPIVRVES
jgi:hypothetical protein